MNLIERILFSLQAEMKCPEPWGWFHLLCLGIMISVIALLYNHKEQYGEKQLKTVLGTYSIVALVLELTKQIIWSFNYDLVTGVTTWNYQWYAAPFQLCTTPIYVCLACFLMKNTKLRRTLLSYIAYITILGSIATIFVPDSCFTKTILVNAHTMWLHYGSFVVSVYLLMSGEIKLNKQRVRDAFCVFALFVVVALLLNIGIYQSGVLNGETFNMFYISPYFISELPVFNFIQENAPYPVFLCSYIFGLGLGSVLIFCIGKLIAICPKPNKKLLSYIKIH